MDEERWAPIPGNEAEVSTHARVRIGDSLLEPRKDAKGYVRFRLPGRRWQQVGVLMLEAFVGPRPPGLLCLHANDIPSDNRLDNLRWGTVKENTHDAIRNGRMKPPYPRPPRLPRPMAEWMTIVEASRYLAVKPSTIRAMIRDGRLKAHRLGPKVVRLRRSEIDAAMRREDDR